MPLISEISKSAMSPRWTAGAYLMEDGLPDLHGTLVFGRVQFERNTGWTLSPELLASLPGSIDGIDALSVKPRSFSYRLRMARVASASSSSRR
jgi:hypothetical protein